MPSLVDLLNAVKHENAEDVELVLSQPYSFNDIQQNIRSIYEAIKVACSVNSEKSHFIAMQLLQDPQLHKAVLSVIADDDNNVLQLAIENNHPASPLLLKFPPVRAVAHCENNAVLELACKKGDPDTVALLLDIDAVRKKAHTNKNFSLLYAAQFGHLPVVRLLLNLPNVKEKAATCKNAAVGAAAYGNHLEVVQLLLSTASVREKAAVQDNQLLKTALEGNATQTILYLLGIEAIANQLLNDPELLVDLCNNPVLLSSLIPIVMKMEFFGFALNDMILPSATQSLFTQPAEILRFFGDPVIFVKQIPRQLTLPLIVESVCIAEVNNRVQRLESAYKTHSETAMSAQALQTAKIGYVTLQRLYMKTFETLAQACGSPDKALEQIEKNIRDMILKSILNETTDANQKNFINDYYQQLIAGTNLALMNQARTFLDSTQNVNHIAWRAYDPFAPVIEWPNLFTSPLQNATIYAAGITDNVAEIDLTEGSNEVRMRTALYYLALKDQSITPLIAQDARESIFIGQIAEIRRAHNESNPKEIDNPSCYPGTLGRIAGMGSGHPQLQMVDPITELGNLIFTMLNRACCQAPNVTPQENEKKCLALTALNQYTIEMLKAGKKLEFNLTTANETLSSEQIIDLRRNLIARLGSPNEVFNQVNQDFQQRNPVIRSLVEDEKVYVERQLIDICYHGVGNRVAANLTLKPAQTNRVILDCSDPFKVKLIEEQLAEVSAKSRMLATRSYANDETRIRMSLEMAQCQNAIYQFVYPKLLLLYEGVDNEALAAFAVIIANHQFKQYDTVKDMQEKWQSNREIADLVIELSANEYKSDPFSAWKGPQHIAHLIDHMKVENLRKAFKKI